MTESPIDEVTRILASWPDADRAAGVLRVVKAMQDAVADTEYRLKVYAREYGLTVSEAQALRTRLALADAAMPIIRPEGFVQFGPNCAIHADKIASPASPIIRNAFLAWMESVEQCHAARTSAARPEPDREERVDHTPSYVGTASSTTTPAMKRGDTNAIPPENDYVAGPAPRPMPDTYTRAEVDALLKALRDRGADEMKRRSESNMRLASINGHYWHERETDAKAYTCAEQAIRALPLWPKEGE